MKAVEMARWPAALEPWLDGATRERALPPAWAASCTKAQAPEAGLKIVSITHGETIRRAGSGAAPSLRMEARGGQQELIWLVDGQQVGRTPAGKALHHAFPEAGRHTVTVMDDSGRYDRVEISVR
jgi:penicillin-binding protein 1C